MPLDESDVVAARTFFTSGPGKRFIQYCSENAPDPDVTKVTRDMYEIANTEAAGWRKLIKFQMASVRESPPVEYGLPSIDVVSD